MVDYDIYKSRKIVYPTLRELSQHDYQKRFGIGDGENTTSEIAGKTGKNKQHISNALNELKEKGIVKSEPEGVRKLYEIDYQALYNDWNENLLKSKEDGSNPLPEFGKTAEIFRWYVPEYFLVNDYSTLEEMLLDHFLYKLMLIEQTEAVEQITEAISRTIHEETKFDFRRDPPI